MSQARRSRGASGDAKGHHQCEEARARGPRECDQSPIDFPARFWSSWVCGSTAGSVREIDLHGRCDTACGSCPPTSLDVRVMSHFVLGERRSSWLPEVTRVPTVAPCTVEDPCLWLS